MDAKVLAIVSATVVTTRSIPPILIVNAEGTVPSGGWSNPKLAPRIYMIAPEDGIWDLDFIATAPKSEATQVISSIPAVLAIPMPPWCKGVRIHASSNSLTFPVFEVSDEALERITIPILDDRFVPIPWGVHMALAQERRDPGDVWPWVINLEISNEAKHQLAQIPTDEKLLISDVLGKSFRKYYESDLISQDYNPNRFNVVLSLKDNLIAKVYIG